MEKDTKIFVASTIATIIITVVLTAYIFSHKATKVIVRVEQPVATESKTEAPKDFAQKL